MIDGLVQLWRIGWRSSVRMPRLSKRFHAMQGPIDHTTRLGHRFRLYPGEYVDGFIFADDMFERRQIEYLQRRLHGRTMLDIGANIGNHSVMLADNFDEIHCFEPNPICVERLSHNLALNHLDKIKVHGVGLGDREATLPFHCDMHGNLGTSSFVLDGQPATHQLPVVVGDQFLAKHGIANIDFIKVDVENFEIEVLHGLSKTIERDRPIICFEFIESPSGGRWQAFVDALPSYVFAEPVRPSRDRSTWGRVSFIVREGGEPKLEPFVPTQLYHEAVLAFPSTAAMSDFDLIGH